ncbi:hypothetical protein GDO78_017128 [Eleutherodactylus coqui]|uniref:Uncharacterized protein n=1 Tax=Eleutherodactylus coqui TaxID=57060 RepID=A0A8J6JW73_ELECQ|nr:hypothetical protein GDO78_017128 [Eleutherodactylus coqui]
MPDIEDLFSLLGLTVHHLLRLQLASCNTFIILSPIKSAMSAVRGMRIRRKGRDALKFSLLAGASALNTVFIY